MRNKIVGVSYNKRVSKWESYINFNKKTYNLGYFEDKKDAIEIRKIAEQKIEDGIFLEWYTELRKNRQRKPRALKKGAGVYYDKNAKKWYPSISYNKKRYILGYFGNKEDAIEIRKIAEHKIEDGIFLEWFNAELNKKRQKKRNGIVYLPTQKKWNSTIWFNKKNYHLGNFKEKEDAENIRSKAREMIDNGTFLEWYSDYHKKLQKANKAGHKGVYQNTNGWRAGIGYNKNQYYLGHFKEKEDAIEIREIAEQKILDGNFEDWYTNLVKDNKEAIIKDKVPLYQGIIYNNKTKLYHAYIYYKKKKYSLCYSKNIKKAIDVRKEAEKHIKIDFIEWFNDYKLKNKSKPVSKETGIYFHQKTQTWFPLIYYKSKKYVLGYFKDKDSAINIRKIAESYKNNGTFLEWFNNYKNLKKKQKMISKD